MTLLFALLTVAAQLTVVGLVGLAALRRVVPVARLRAAVLGALEPQVLPLALVVALALAGLPISAYHYLVERFRGWRRPAAARTTPATSCGSGTSTTSRSR